MNQRQYLAAMGIQVWQRPEDPTPAAQKLDQVEHTWESLAATISTCTACSLHCSRTQTVFGVGDRQAKLMIIGEAPGYYEDQQGEPFVGRAGQLLNAILKAINLNRTQVYIANILKCRPPQNRDPQPEEVALCTPYLQQQIEWVKPDLLVAVGKVAAHHLLKSKEAMGQMRGKVYLYEGNTPLMVTYHPAYLLRSPREKAAAWSDWQQVRSALAIS